MKKSLLNIVAEKTRKVIRQALSPTFLVCLLCSALLWYASRLNGEYDTDIPLNIRIDGQKYRLTATVTGRGSNILAHRLSLKRRLSFTLDELSPRPSRQTLGALTIAPTSLQRAINGRNTGLTVVQVIDAPEFIPQTTEEPAEGETTKEAGARTRAKSGAKSGAAKKTAATKQTAAAKKDKKGTAK